MTICDELTILILLPAFIIDKLMLGSDHTLLQTLGEKSPIQGKLNHLYKIAREHHPDITRVAIVLYDHASDLLKTFVYCAEKETPLPWYQAYLRECPSLKTIAETGEPRIVNHIPSTFTQETTHSKAIIESGYTSSYTIPMIYEGHFFGFIFFNSDRPNTFSDEMAPELDMIGCMIALLIFNERSNIRTLIATVKSALDVTHSRDPETCTHLERMSRYSRLIARKLAPKYGFDDSFIEHLYLFSPLHDIGKIKVPDSVLLKEGRLTDDEFDVMKQHVENGRDLIDTLLSNFGLSGVSHVGILRNIVLYHHEYLDGSGYPYGLSSTSIPIESRIVTTADVFDALTSKRPYKEAWSNDKAFIELEKLAGKKIDADCVNALLTNLDEIERIQSTFKENAFG